MKRPGSDQRGFSLVELLVVTVVGGLLALSLLQFITHSLRGAEKAESLSLAQHRLDDILKSVRTNFQRRFWKFPHINFAGYDFLSLTPAPGFINPGIIPGIALTTGTVFKPNAGGAGSFHCPPPSSLAVTCQDMKMMQTLASRDPGVADTHREVAYETKCQSAGDSPKFPSDFKAIQYQSDGSHCPNTPPVVTMTVAGKPVQSFLGDKIVGTALCFRACTLSSNGNPTRLPVVEYQVEAAVIYRAAKKWKVLKGTTTLSTGDLTEGIEVLPPHGN